MPLLTRSRRLPAGLGMIALVGILALGACQSPDQPGASTGTPRVSAEPTAMPATPDAPTPDESASASAAPTVTPSDNLDNITVSGERLAEPKVTLRITPWAIDETRVTVLSPGDGATVGEAGPVTVHYYGVNGRTGEKFDDSFSRGEPVTFALDQVVPGFQKGLAGQKVGSRVVIAMPGSDGYDASGGSPQAGIEVGDTLIFVVDITDTVLPGPQGAAQDVPADLPQVSGSAQDPRITVPRTDPPAEVKVATVIKGMGAEVSETSTVTLHYRGVLWADGKVIDQNYGSDESPAQTDLDTLIPGFRQGLLTQTVGSRVLVVIPPDQAYGDAGNPDLSVPANATLVYVVDILFAQAGP